MSSLMAFLAPLALAAATQAAPPPVADAVPDAPESAVQGWTIEWSLATVPLTGLAISAPEGRSVWRKVADAFRAEPAEQVRIEQRMIIRITPLGPERELLADLPRAPLASKFRERKVGKCVSVSGIAGVQIGGDDRLLLFMRDQRLIGASLEKACQARDFYSGFYVDRARDGQLCVDRDLIHARSGTACSVSRLRQLLAVDD